MSSSMAVGARVEIARQFVLKPLGKKLVKTLAL
jgi:hypothetical protein